MSIQAKIFKYINGDGKAQLVKFRHNPLKEDYYDFIRRYGDKGLGQVIITSEIMLEVIIYYFVCRSFEIVAIEFMGKGGWREREIPEMLEKLRGDRGYYNYNNLIFKLSILLGDEFENIKEIRLKGNCMDGGIGDIFIRVNGVFGVTDKYFDLESNNLIKIVTGGLKRGSRYGQ
jgi:hypothetical protein